MWDSVLMIIPLLAALQLLFTFDVEEERAAIFFPFFQVEVQENEGRGGRSLSQSEKLVVLSYLTSFD